MINHARMTRKRLRGFTLIEILIVIVIISIISGIAVVTISTNKTKQLETFAHQLTRLMTLAEQEAMLQPHTLGLAFSPHHFQFFIYKPSSDQEHPWQAITTKNLGWHTIPDYIKITLQINDENKILNGKPSILISESGDITPFRLHIAKAGSKPAYVVIGDSTGNIRTQVYHEK